MDVDTAITAALRATRANSSELHESEDKLKAARKELKALRERRNQVEASMEEGTLEDPAELDVANKTLTNKLAEVSGLSRSIRILREAAEAARSGQVWKAAFEAIVNERLEKQRAEWLKRFTDWTLPEDLDTARGSLEALLDDGTPEERTPLPIPVPATRIDEQMVPMVMDPPSPAEIAEMVGENRKRDGLAERLSSFTSRSEHGLAKNS